MLKLAHHATRDLVQTDAVNAETHVGTRYLEVVEERSLQCRIVGPSGVNQFIISALGLPDGSDEWSHLDEVRSGSGNNADVHA
jgi:hypothetical protein